MKAPGGGSEGSHGEPEQRGPLASWFLQRIPMEGPPVTPGPRVCVGGVGGSGTRVLAAALGEAGVFMGSQLNRSLDNLEFPFEPVFQALFHASSEAEARGLVEPALRGFASGMQEAMRATSGATCWGWKVPTSYYNLHLSLSVFPELRYVHLIRNGLDMAFSQNQRQHRRWGPSLGITPTSVESPASSLEYWIRANRFALEHSERLLGSRRFVVLFEELVREPARVLGELFRALELDAPEERLREASSAIHPPESLGRYREHPWREIFSPEQLSAVRALGFPDLGQA